MNWWVGLDQKIKVEVGREEEMREGIQRETAKIKSHFSGSMEKYKLPKICAIQIKSPNNREESTPNLLSLIGK